MIGTPVFVYPHAYLRDRQLDTVRAMQHDVINRDAFDAREGSQVAKGATGAAARRSWKSRLPLINIKRRPSEAPEGSTVYLWNGIMASGPFITDIDNPYAFTAYNVGATRLYRLVIRALLERDSCREIICMSNACLQGVSAVFGAAVGNKARLRYPQVPSSVRPRRERSDNSCRFLFIGTQFEIKGGGTLLRAFKSVRNAYPNATLDIITHLPPSFRDAARDQPGVAVHEATLGRDEIASRFIAQSDVLVHPTHMDSFGMVILESIAAGLPVIASDLYAIPELVEDGLNGFLVHPPVGAWNRTEPVDRFFADTSALADTIRGTDMPSFESALAGAMITLAQDPELRARMGAASRKLAETRFDA